MKWAALAVLVVGVASASCAGTRSGSSTSAQASVHRYIDAIDHDDPRAAYALLSKEQRKKLPYERFAEQWKASATERKLQADALRESVKAVPDLGARAIVTYKDGKVIAMTHEGSAWHLERALMGRVVASSPRDAVRALTRSLANADFAGFVRVLSKRKREALIKMLSAFSDSLDNHRDHFIQHIGDDRAQMRWEDRSGRYRIDLVREQGEWRIDDFDVVLSEEECKADDPECGS